MNFKQMEERCGKFLFITKAFLIGYKFVYDGYSKRRKGAVANVVESHGDVVEGGIFLISNECLKNLDRHEGYPNVYFRKKLFVNGADGNNYYAIVYLRKPLESGKPDDEYRKIVLEGAKDCGLSDSYINKYILG